jgi:hypothetical protein
VNMRSEGRTKERYLVAVSRVKGGHGGRVSSVSWEADISKSEC